MEDGPGGALRAAPGAAPLAFGDPGSPAFSALMPCHTRTGSRALSRRRFAVSGEGTPLDAERPGQARVERFRRAPPLAVLSRRLPPGSVSGAGEDGATERPQRQDCNRRRTRVRQRRCRRCAARFARCQLTPAPVSFRRLRQPAHCRSHRSPHSCRRSCGAGLLILRQRHTVRRCTTDRRAPLRPGTMQAGRTEQKIGLPTAPKQASKAPGMTTGSGASLRDRALRSNLHSLRSLR